MYSLMDGTILCDGCADGCEEAHYTLHFDMREDEIDDHKCSVCGGNDFKEGDC